MASAYINAAQRAPRHRKEWVWPDLGTLLGIDGQALEIGPWRRALSPRVAASWGVLQLRDLRLALLGAGRGGGILGEMCGAS